MVCFFFCVLRGHQDNNNNDYDHCSDDPPEPHSEQPKKNKGQDLELAFQGALKWASKEIKEQQVLQQKQKKDTIHHGYHDNRENTGENIAQTEISPSINSPKIVIKHDIAHIREKVTEEGKKDSGQGHVSQVNREIHGNTPPGFPQKIPSLELQNKKEKFMEISQKKPLFFSLNSFSRKPPSTIIDINKENRNLYEETLREKQWAEEAFNISMEIKEFHKKIFSQDNKALSSHNIFPEKDIPPLYRGNLPNKAHGVLVAATIRKNLPFFDKPLETKGTSGKMSTSYNAFYRHQKEFFTQQKEEIFWKDDIEKPSFFALWWHSLDRLTLFSILFLILLGLWLIMAISPAIALQHHWSTFVLLKRHGQMMVFSLVLLLGATFSKRSVVIAGAWILLILAWTGSLACVEIGQEIKGARRWLSLGGFTLQPSEFLKPALSLVLAQLLSLEKKRPSLLLFGFVFLLVGFFLIPLFLQPDLGTLVLLFGVSMAQCFAAGLPWIVTGILGCCTVVVLALLYLYFPHAAHRIGAFLGSSGNDDPFGGQYQILQGLKSFTSGGWLGKGPGAGTYFHNLPDGHADFIFAVAGEEFGLLVCCFIVLLYLVITFRSLINAIKKEDSFYRLAIVGLSLCFGCQTIINLASVLRLMPTKGMTLPLMSYGGSSLMATALILGLILGLGRRYRWII